jgi:hypothetical protein
VLYNKTTIPKEKSCGSVQKSIRDLKTQYSILFHKNMSTSSVLNQHQLKKSGKKLKIF